MEKFNKLFTILVLINFKMVSANKYCSLQSVTGQSRYFMCGRHEYCCTFGCCVHLAFQFYQLWYYWLLLIFMFMVCSGGSWWYKFCRQNDSSSLNSNIPNQVSGTSDLANTYYNGSHSIHSNSSRTISYGNGSRQLNGTPTNDYERRVTFVRNNGVHSYYYRGPRNPNYYETAVVRYQNGERSSRRYQHHPGFVSRPELCPYYQLYGPPPSYESVVQLSSDNTTACTLAEPSPSTTIHTTNTSTTTVIQPSITVNLTNALPTSIEERPISVLDQQQACSSTEIVTTDIINSSDQHDEIIKNDEIFILNNSKTLNGDNTSESETEDGTKENVQVVLSNFHVKNEKNIPSIKTTSPQKDEASSSLSLNDTVTTSCTCLMNSSKPAERNKSKLIKPKKFNRNYKKISNSDTSSLSSLDSIKKDGLEKGLKEPTARKH